jgi:hypothetical protein
MALSDSEAPPRCHRPPAAQKTIFIAEPITAEFESPATAKIAIIFSLTHTILLYNSAH